MSNDRAFASRTVESVQYVGIGHGSDSITITIGDTRKGFAPIAERDLTPSEAREIAGDLIKRSVELEPALLSDLVALLPGDVLGQAEIPVAVAVELAKRIPDAIREVVVGPAGEPLDTWTVEESKLVDRLEAAARELDQIIAIRTRPANVRRMIERLVEIRDSLLKGGDE